MRAVAAVLAAEAPVVCLGVAGGGAPIQGVPAARRVPEVRALGEGQVVEGEGEDTHRAHSGPGHRLALGPKNICENKMMI